MALRAGIALVVARISQRRSPLGFSVSPSRRLKATRGSHAPAARHLSLHLLLRPPLCLSLSLSHSIRRYSQLGPAPASVNHGRDAYARGETRIDPGMIFLTSRAMIYYARVVGALEYCITPGRAELESVRNRNWRVRAEVLDLVRGPSIRPVSMRVAENASRFSINASVDACRSYLTSFSLSLFPVR